MQPPKFVLDLSDYTTFAVVINALADEAALLERQAAEEDARGRVEYAEALRSYAAVSMSLSEGVSQAGEEFHRDHPSMQSPVE
ncbi:MAG: hypothetical protein ABIN55_14230 [Aeromicrobium sp.]